MAGKANFNITPSEIRSAATNMETSLREFVRAYKNIYAATSDLRVTFQGEASNAYNQRIEQYRADFVATERSVKQFIEFLQRYSGEATRTEGDLSNVAKTLPAGRRG